jgi:hypothetical protein
VGLRAALLLCVRFVLTHGGKKNTHTVVSVQRMHSDFGVAGAPLWDVAFAAISVLLTRARRGG